MSFVDTVARASQVIDIAGIVIIVGGIVRATVFYTPRAKTDSAASQYRRYRQTVGRAILLGLEFFLAADIIRTVAVDPTFRSVGVLAIIVAIRTFLSLELDLEIDGEWPWQRGSSPVTDDTPTSEEQMRSLPSVGPVLR